MTKHRSGPVNELSRRVSLHEAHASMLDEGARGLTANHLIAGIQCGQFDFEQAMVFLRDLGRNEDARRVDRAIHTYFDSKEST